MKTKQICIAAWIVFSFGLTAGCGGGGLTNGYLPVPEPDKSIVNADVAKWVDSSTSAAVTSCNAANATPQTIADSINVKVAFNAYPNLTNASGSKNLLIQNVDFSFTPITAGAPAISQPSQPVNLNISVGGSASVPVQVASQSLKSSLLANFSCGDGKMYSYYLSITFNVKDDFNNTAKATTVIKMDFADFVD
ncbi:MAG: hypothetical protein HYV06_00360 [Deltaproteobacteria bacterium]|nr:hypothetical protein [Deltaproteobacteria bacterium]